MLKLITRSCALRSISDADRRLGGTGHSAIIHALHLVLAKFHLRAHLPAFLTDPTPIVFLWACCTYAFALFHYHILYVDNAHQANFFAAGVTLPFPVGLLCGADLRSIATKVLPWSIILSLIVSAAFHGCYRSLRKEFDEEQVICL